VSVVDFYDALTMDRVYRTAFSHARAMEMVQEQRGKAFDPDVVDCFVQHSDALRALRQKVTDTHMSFAELVQTPQPLL
jgi:putative two-component system response regulator